MMDLSDGLGSDLPRLAEASRVGFEIDPVAVPRKRGCSMESAIGDGEDYELLFTVARKQVAPLLAAWRTRFSKIPLTPVGRLVADTHRQSGLVPGYMHFSDCQGSRDADS